MLRGLGVSRGDRIAYIAPNTHAQLESFYAVPQIGAVLVPINYRLTAADFAYLINHSGARVVCETENVSSFMRASRCCVSVVFPAPDGEQRIKRRSSSIAIASSLAEGQ